jgi:5-methylcytosine-specific restriction protein A
MPYSPLKPCRHSGCSELIDPKEKYCAKHKALHHENQRPSPSRRGYGKRWQRESKKFLATHPFCVRCQQQGKLVSATVVDHITPHRNRPELLWDWHNWQPLCKPCHDKKTFTEDVNPLYTYDDKI